MSRLLAIGGKSVDSHDDTGIYICKRDNFPRNPIYLLRDIKTARAREIENSHDRTTGFLVIKNVANEIGLPHASFPAQEGNPTCSRQGKDDFL